MAIVEASDNSGLEEFQPLHRNLVAGAKATGTGTNVGMDDESIVGIGRIGYDEQNMKVSVQEKDSIVNVRSPIQIILSLTMSMLVERGSLDANEKVSKYWPEYVAKREKDVEVRHLLPSSLGAGVSGWNREIPIEDVSELVRRIDGRSLEQFIAEDIACPLGLNLHQRVSGEKQKDCRSQNQRQPTATKPEVLLTCTKPKHNSNGHAVNENGVLVQNVNERREVKKLYPDTIPPHQSHPYACDFSVIDQGSIGKALVTHRDWQQGEFMARFDGLTVPDVMLHTLQKTTRTHLWDPYFIGTLAHSCDPNVILDMGEHEMWAVKDIEPGTVLTMDYASTEDHLFRTFQCKCTAPGCRGEVTGRKQRRSTYTHVSQKSV